MKLKLFIFKIILATLIALLPFSTVNFIVDPYQFYRIPKFYKPVYFNDQRYQNPGLAKTQNYSLAIIGTSMSDNFLLSYMNNALNRKTIRLSAIGASMYEQRLTAEVVIRSKKADTIIYELNYFSFRGASDRVTHTGKGFPYHMYQRGIMSHLKYLCNPETLLRSYQVLLKHYKGIMHSTMVEDLEKLNTWYDRPNFGKGNVLLDWNMAQNDLQRADPDEFKWEYIKENADKNLLDLIKSNPETEFILFYPPFSILMHKFLDNRGLFDEEIKLKQYIYENTKNLHNVKIYDFQDIKEITHNLDNYSDMSHYSIEINEYIINSIAKEQHLVNDSNIEQKLNNLIKQVEEYEVEK
ncbi:MAG TPA: hypothetical protein GXX37_11890 [Clostridiaceae bacterium]|nr:hypothetical protein [Clostridiaceae bacterium]